MRRVGNSIIPDSHGLGGEGQEVAVMQEVVSVVAQHNRR